jgi:hypothetical protein
VDPDDFEEKQEPLENANLDQLDELGEVCSRVYSTCHACFS